MLRSRSSELTVLLIDTRHTLPLIWLQQPIHQEFDCIIWLDLKFVSWFDNFFPRFDNEKLVNRWIVIKSKKGHFQIVIDVIWASILFGPQMVQQFVNKLWERILQKY